MTAIPDDAELLTSVADRDVRAFQALYERYAGAVYSLAQSILRDAHAAQDVAQDVFVSIWRGAASYNPARGSARNWILALAHHKSVDAVRRSRARAAEPLSESTPAGGDAVEEALKRVDAAEVRAALAALSAEQRAALVLAYFGGYTQREIAERTGAPLGTVKTRMRDGLLRLRASLGRAPAEDPR